MSWYTYGAIVDEAIGFARDEASRPPTACPNDGEPLRTGPDGELYCPYDGWRPNGSTVAADVFGR